MTAITIEELLRLRDVADASMAEMMALATRRRLISDNSPAIVMKAMDDGHMFRNACEEYVRALTAPAEGGGAVYRELTFDGPAVYDHMTDDAKRRTGPENVSDVLDALHRAAKAAIANAKGEDSNGKA